MNKYDEHEQTRREKKMRLIHWLNYLLIPCPPSLSFSLTLSPSLTPASSAFSLKLYSNACAWMSLLIHITVIALLLSFDWLCCKIICAHHHSTNDDKTSNTIIWDSGYLHTAHAQPHLKHFYKYKCTNEINKKKRKNTKTIITSMSTAAAATTTENEWIKWNEFIEESVEGVKWMPLIYHRDCHKMMTACRAK